MTRAPEGTGAASWLTFHTPERRAQLARTEVVVLFGGDSAERDVSLVSGPAIAASLAQPEEPALASVTPVEIAADGRWILGDVSLAPTAALESLPAGALFFLGLHGGAGEDGRLQGFLEVAGRRYTGSGPSASALSMDKWATRALLAQAGVAVAPGSRVTAVEWQRDRDACLQALPLEASGALYVKPASGGSSLLTARVESREAAATAIDAVLRAGDHALCESAVSGLETTAALIGTRGADPHALPLVEIRPRQGAFFDYEEKYAAEGALETCPPSALPDALQAHIQDAARAAWHATGCDGHARVDFIVPLDGASGFGVPVALELNTLPGFTPRSLLPLAAAADGAGFRELCLELCSLALERP